VEALTEHPSQKDMGIIMVNTVEASGMHINGSPYRHLRQIHEYGHFVMVQRHGMFNTGSFDMFNRYIYSQDQFLKHGRKTHI
jgi:hypothetical protein